MSRIGAFVRRAGAARGPAFEGLEFLEQRQMMSSSGLYLSPFFLNNDHSDAPIFSTDVDVASDDLSLAPSSSVTDSLIHLTQFRQDAGFAGIDGSGVSVAVLDTGIDLDHPFFGGDVDHNGIADRIVYQHDFADNDNNASDVNGHGSNVSSIVGSQDSTYGGMAPGVNIIHLKVFKNDGSGSFSYVESALQWVFANVNTYNIVAVNMSLGDNGNYNTAQQKYGISDELAALAGLNVATIVAAGNSYSQFAAQGLAYPAADPNVIAVGAVYDQNFGGVSYVSGAQAYGTGADRITPFSQRTTSMYEIFAPGAPITGAGPNGNLVTEHGTSQAAPHIAGIVALAQQYSLQAMGRRLSVTELRTLMTSTAANIVDGDDENDNVANTGATYKRVDVEALGQAIQAMAPVSGPRATLKLGSAIVADGGTLDFGSTTTGAPVVKTLTVTNTGTQNLTLTSLDLPSGFSVASGFSAALVAPGASATVSIRFDAGSVGLSSGTATFATNDPNAPSFSLTLTGTGVGFASIRNDNTATYTGTWSVGTTGFNSDTHYKAKGTGAATANWTFTNLDPGVYRVAATWTAKATAASNASYTVLDGAVSAGTGTLNQRLVPGSRTISGIKWADIGTFSITGSRLTVRLSDAADGIVLADAIRIDRVDNLAGGAEVSVKAAGVSLATGGAVAFGSSPSGTPVSRVFTVRNVGGSDLDLSSFNLPAGFVMATPPDRTLVTPGSSATFTVRTASGAPGTYSGALTLGTSDSDEGTFSINLSTTVTARVATIDDGDAGFVLGGTWGAATTGYLGDSRAHLAGTGSSTATWKFNGLVAGTYRVYATWVAGSNRASNAPYTITTGGVTLGSVAVDQRVAPAERNVSSAWWKNLGDFSISGTSLWATLSDAADNRVVADAVRIERVGN